MSGDVESSGADDGEGEGESNDDDSEGAVAFVAAAATLPPMLSSSATASSPSPSPNRGPIVAEDILRAEELRRWYRDDDDAVAATAPDGAGTPAASAMELDKRGSSKFIWP